MKPVVYETTEGFSIKRGTFEFVWRHSPLHYPQNLKTLGIKPWDDSRSEIFLNLDSLSMPILYDRIDILQIILDDFLDALEDFPCLIDSIDIGLEEAVTLNRIEIAKILIDTLISYSDNSSWYYSLSTMIKLRRWELFVYWLKNVTFNIQQICRWHNIVLHNANMVAEEGDPRFLRFLIDKYPSLYPWRLSLSRAKIFHNPRLRSLLRPSLQRLCWSLILREGISYEGLIPPVFIRRYFSGEIE